MNAAKSKLEMLSSNPGGGQPPKSRARDEFLSDDASNTEKKRAHIAAAAATAVAGERRISAGARESVVLDKTMCDFCGGSNTKTWLGKRFYFGGVWGGGALAKECVFAHSPFSVRSGE